MEKTLLKILYFGISICLCFFVANAAPTVKKLGTQAGTNNAAPIKTTTSTPGRVSSVRFDTTTTTTAAPKKVSSTNVDSTRLLPSSKYLQVAHSLKPATSTGSAITPTPSSEDISGLKDHVNNTEVHVTSVEKETWNEKQDPLTAGPGIEIEDNVISATMKLPVGSEDAPRTAPIWVE